MYVIKILVDSHGVRGVDRPTDKTALEILMAINESMNIMYKAAIKEEAARVNQMPDQIKKLIDVVRTQRHPGDN